MVRIYPKPYNEFMILLAHIIIALVSLGSTTYAFFHPTRLTLRISYLLVALTVATGTYLILMSPAHMLQTCTTGLVYLGVVTLGILAARQRLARV